MLLPMSPTDSMFLLAETRDYPMHVGGLQLFQPPDGMDALDVRGVFDAAVATSEVSPFFTKRARRGITSLGQWGWEQDPAFDLEHHVRRSALPQPGRVLELLALCSRLHSTLLDRHRPLWEIHLIEGLNDGRYAIYTKAHHAMLDGVSALRMLARVLSEDPDQRDMPPPWAPPTRPKKADGEQSNPVRTLMDLVGDTAGLVPALARTVSRGITQQGGTLSLSAPKSMFNVPITGARRFAAQSWPMERIKRVAKATDATLNDVVLAMCSGALRRYLADHGGVPEVPLVSVVPISVRAEGGGGEGANQVSAMFVGLATNLEDPVERLRAISSSTKGAKEEHNALGADVLMNWAEFAAPGLFARAMRTYSEMNLADRHRPIHNVIISNVPGPPFPLYLAGSRLSVLSPLGPIMEGAGLNVTVMSYMDRVDIGLIACRESIPDIWDLAQDFEESIAELKKAAGL